MRALAIVFLVLPFIGCAHTGVPTRNVITDPFTAEQAEVKAVIDDIVATVQKQDLDHLESLHSYTPKFSKFEDDGLGRQDAEAGRKGERTMADLKSLAVHIDDLKIDVFGGTAIATGILSYKIDTGAQQVAGKDRFTLVFVHTDGAWKIVHEHSSPLAAPAGPPPA
ncbi:MAG: nuclear transport factor 2 family protein [Deltaproteobacteria bacterium]